jgi:succinate-semialdehyde dehydrogenase/glutarate-semialdehyde dehydrogenase
VADVETLKAQGRALIRDYALVAGERVRSGRTIPVDDPATGEIVGAAPGLGAAETERAIEAAAQAFTAWSATKPHERAAFLRRWADRIDAKEDALAALLALENGKPLEEARGEVRYANAFNRWFAGQAEALAGEVMDSTTPGHTILTFKEAVGPVGAITPWNFPAAMITRKAAAAFAAGCTFVVKPAMQTPFTAIAMAELAWEAGLPPQAFSVVTGEAAPIGERLTRHPAIRKFSFTGSTPVGRMLAEQCAPDLKRVSLELGGAAPLVVFEDADLDLAVVETIKGKFRNSGQTCVCPNRVYVHRAVLDAYLERLVPAVAALKVGAAFEPDVKIGPLIDDKGLNKVADLVERAKAEGARVLTGGAKHDRGGRFFQPTVLAGEDDRLFRTEEIFGPVVPVYPFDAEAEAIEKANATPYGLASFFFTRDLDRTMRVGRALQYGIVGVNAGVVSSAVAPFGGIKQSGYGREGSVYGLEEYLSVKGMTLALR